MAIDWARPMVDANGFPVTPATVSFVRDHGGCLHAVDADGEGDSISVVNVPEPEPAVEDLSFPVRPGQFDDENSPPLRLTTDDQAKRIAELENEIERLSHENSERKGAVESLSSAVDAKQAGIRRLTAEIDKRDKRISELEDANADLSREVERLTELANSWSALARSSGGLVWSDKKPDRPGWWWLGYHGVKRAVEIVEYRGKLVAFHPFDSDPVVSISGRWCPIPEPAEPGEKPAPDGMSSEKKGFLSVYALSVFTGGPDTDAAKAIYRTLSGETQEHAKEIDRLWRTLHKPEMWAGEKLPATFDVEYH